MTDTTTTTAAAPADPAAEVKVAAEATNPTTDAAASTGTVLGGKAEAKKEGAKGPDQGQSSGENKTTPAAEAEINVVLPEGVKVDQAMLDGFKVLAKEHGLNSETATKVATWYVEQQAAAEKAQLAESDKRSSEWEKELKADPTFGGVKFAERAAKAQQALLKYGGPDTIKAIVDAGLGNWPPLVRAFAAVGEAMAEDSTASSRAPGGLTQLSEVERNKLRYDKSQ